MTDYALDDVVSVRTNCASLSQGKFIMAASSHPAIPDSRIITVRRDPPASVFAHELRSDLTNEEWQETDKLFQGQANNLQAAMHVLTAVTSSRLVRWKSREGYDVRNFVIARSGPGIQNSFWANIATLYSYEETTGANALAVRLSEQVIDFCHQHQVSNWLQLALRQVHQSFTPLIRIHVEVEHDRESDEEWLDIIAEVHAEPDAVLAMYAVYTKAMLKVVPWPARDKIRLIYDIV